MVEQQDQTAVTARLAARAENINATIDLLTSEFKGVFNRETVERFVNDSVERMSNSKVQTYVVSLSGRFARERLHALARIEKKADSTTPSVLFLCTHNAGRSQMAAAWMRKLAGDRIQVYSGGSEPASDVNPVAIDAMAEVGIDISTEYPKPWTDEIVQSANVVVTMGCGDACPVFPAIRYVDWEVADPADEDLDAVRAIRDDIKERVRGLMDELGVGATE